MPDQQQNLLTEIYVKVDGQEATSISVTVNQQSHTLMDDLLEVTVENSLHLPDVATLTLNDSSLQWIDKDTLAPGKTLQVSAKAGQSQTEHKLFDGEIVELEPDYSPSTQKFVIRAFDRLHRLSRGRQVETYLNMTDSDIASKIASKLGLSPEVDATNQVHDFVMQKNETHLEFLQARAALIGYLVWVDEKKLHFEKPPPAQGPIELNWGETFNEFHPRWSTVGQVDNFTVRSWDPKNKQAIVGSASAGDSAPQVGVQPGGSVTSGAFGSSTALMTHSPLRSQGLADNLAKSVADRTSGKYI